MSTKTIDGRRVSLDGLATPDPEPGEFATVDPDMILFNYRGSVVAIMRAGRRAYGLADWRAIQGLANTEPHPAVKVGFDAFMGVRRQWGIWSWGLAPAEVWPPEILALALESDVPVEEELAAVVRRVHDEGLLP